LIRVRVAIRAESYLKFTGLADTVYVGPEAEFFVFDEAQYHNNQIRPVYHGQFRGRTLEIRANVKAEIRRHFRARASRIPVSFLGIDRETGRILIIVILRFVKDEEFGFGADIDRVGESGKFQIAFGAELRPNADQVRNLLW